MINLYKSLKKSLQYLERFAYYKFMGILLGGILIIQLMQHTLTLMTQQEMTSH